MPKQKPVVVAPKKQKPAVEVPKKEHFFPRALMWYAILMVLAALNSYFLWIDVPDIVYSILMLLGGLWMFNIGMSKGFWRQRRGKLMKYI